MLNANEGVRTMRVKILKYITRLSIPTYIPSTISDAFNNVYSGLLLSRLYQGSKVITNFATESGAQNFAYKCKTGSLGHILRTHYKLHMDLFNGSSVATYTMVRLATHLSVPQKGFRLITKKSILSSHERERSSNTLQS